jgi:predicted aldo/keto reductase-like oxidoreductase
MPCGLGIDVPRIFEIYNDAVMYGDTATAREIYRREKHNLDDCTECGTCVNKCGMKIPITDWLKKVRPVLAEDK